MNYQLLNEDENSYTVKHPKLGEMKIAKQAISDALHEHIKSLAPQKMSKGGKVSKSGEDALSSMGVVGEDDPLLVPDEAEPKSSGLMSVVGEGLKQAKDTILTSLPTSPNLYDDSGQAPTMGDYYNQPKFTASSPDSVVAGPAGPAFAGKMPRNALPLNQSPVPINGEVTSQGQLPGAGASQPGQAPQQTGVLNIQDPLAMYRQAQKDMMGAAEQQKKASTEYSQAALKTQEDGEKKRQEVDNLYNEKIGAYNKQSEELFKLAYDQKIDPNKLWHNTSTGGKIAVGIGMILSGIGSGLTGGPNLALQTMNKLIDNDIDAQKANLGKTQSLYAMNLQKTRDAQSAYAMTKSQIASWVDGQMAQAAAKKGTPEAQAAYLNSKAQIGMMVGQLNAQVAQQQGDKMIYDLAMKTQDPVYIQRLPKDVRERWVPGYGPANNEQVAQKANEVVATTRSGVDLLKQLSRYADAAGSKFSLEDKAKAETLSRMIMGQIREGVLGPGTVNEGERKILESMVSNPTYLTQLPSTAKASLNTIITSIQAKERNQLRQYGLTPNQPLDLAPAKR